MVAGSWRGWTGARPDDEKNHQADQNGGMEWKLNISCMHMHLARVESIRPDKLSSGHFSFYYYLARERCNFWGPPPDGIECG
jgi:hypothetical protein